MARANQEHKPKPVKRTSRRKTSRASGRGALPPNCQALDDVYFQRWRDLFGGERAQQHLEDLLRSKPSWHVDARGKVTRSDGFWPSATLSEEINAEGVDCLAVHYTAPVHGTDYSQYNGRFFVRPVDIIEYEERWSGNNVISDYSPIEQFEREIEGRPRTPPRLAPTAPTPAPKKKRRKAKQPLHAAAPPSTVVAPAVSEVATQDVSHETQGVDPLNTGAKSGRKPSAEQAAQDLLDNGVRPGSTVTWVKFCHDVRVRGDGFAGDPKNNKYKRGFTDDRITRVTRSLMKRQA